jgi:hypothetical protein
VPLDLKAATLCCGAHYFDRLGHDLEADVIAFEYAYVQCSAHLGSVNSDGK